MTLDPRLKVALVAANLLALVGLAGFGADYWVRLRASQAITAYHQQVIQPLIRPNPQAPGAPKP